MFKLKYFQVLLIFILTAYADFQKKSNNTLIGGGGNQNDLFSNPSILNQNINKNLLEENT